MQEDGVKSPRTSTLREVALAVAAIALFSVFSAAQDAPATGSAASGETAGAIHDLQDQIHQLQTMVEQMRSENAQSRAEMHQLRQDLQATRALLG